MIITEKLIGKENGIITVYGEAGSGKTLLCILLALEVAKKQGKIIYIDPQGNFPIERAKQLDFSYKTLMQNIMTIRPKSFAEQEKLLDTLRKSNGDKTAMLIIDPISFFYRLEHAKNEIDSYMINRNLGLQLMYLNDIARKKNALVIVTSETHAKPEGGQEASMVGASTLDHMSNYVIEIKKYENGKRTAVLKKPKDGARKEVKFEIIESGIRILE